MVNKISKTKGVSSSVFMCAALGVCLFYPSVLDASSGKPKLQKEDKVYRSYVDFFREIYDTMQANYYQPLKQEDFDKFLEKFRKKIYAQLKGEKRSDDYVRWRSAAFLVEDLRSKEDIFSAFYPPEPAKEYAASALDVRMDLGIEGKKIDRGYLVTKVEPRADAYLQGVREYDILLEIEGNSLSTVRDEEIKKLLNPKADTVTKIKFWHAADNTEKTAEVSNREFFRQSVFMLPIPVPGYYGIKIEHFNRKTGEDVFRFLKYFQDQGPINGLVIDLRGNPGGPPLAAREISSFFLKGGETFAYFEGRPEDRAYLDVPELPEKYHYDGPIVILIDEESGSATELFSGILQRKGRAVLMGRNSAGQVMLKSMFNFDDGSMVLLVTARGHHPDGTVFSFSGLNPDRFVSEKQEDEILKYAVNYLIFLDRTQSLKTKNPI